MTYTSTITEPERAVVRAGRWPLLHVPCRPHRRGRRRRRPGAVRRARPSVPVGPTSPAGRARPGHGNAGRCGRRRTTLRVARAPVDRSVCARRSMSSRSFVAIRPSAVWVQPPTTRPSTQIVGPALPLRSNSCAPCGPRNHSRSLYPMTVASRPGSSRTQRPGGSVAIEVVGQDPARGAVAQVDLDGADGVERRPRLLHRPAGPPLDVGRRPGAEGAQPSADELRARLVVIDRRQRRAEPRLELGPAVLAADPRAARTGAHDPSLGGQQEQHARGHAHLPGPRLPLAEDDLVAELGDVLRQLDRGGLTACAQRREGALADVVQPRLGVLRDALVRRGA